MSRLQAHQEPHRERVGALPQSHFGLCGTPVGPSKDTHGTPVPNREGRGWPATTTTKTTNNKRPQDTDKRQDKRAFRKQLLTDSCKLTKEVLVVLCLATGRLFARVHSRSQIQNMVVCHIDVSRVWIALIMVAAMATVSKFAMSRTT